VSPSPSLWADTRPAERERPAPPPEPPAAPPPRKGGQGPRRILAGAAAVLALVAGALVLGRTTGGDESPSATVAPLVDSGGGSGSGGGTVGRVAAAAGPGVVSVQAGSASGTGFVVGADGTIVTNAHVVAGAETARVRFDDGSRQADAEVLGTDPSSDLAVLRVDPGDAGGLTVLRLADSDAVAVGDPVVAIGHPFGLDRTVTAGIVSGVGRQIRAPDGFSIDEVIQTDAPINPGNSGGPLLDTRGRVIGVNSQIATAGNRGNVGIGFAVPSNAVRDVLPTLKRGERVERPWLGVATSPALSGGARVERVEPDSPAARAGVRPGDIVTSAGGREVRDPEDLTSALDGRSPGEQLDLQVQRGGGTEELQVELGTRPAQAGP
jgi:putative serine protease PepD